MIEEKNSIEKKDVATENPNDEIERETVFYYSREHRLSRAPQRIRDFNEERTGKSGRSKGLFSNKGNMFILISILVICAMFALNSRISGAVSEVKLGGNTVALNIVMEEGVQMLSIVKRAAGKGDVYAGEVDVAVSPVKPKSRAGEESPVFTQRIFFHPVESEVFSFSLPFDINAEGDSFYVILKTSYELKTAKVNVRGNR